MKKYTVTALLLLSFILNIQFAFGTSVLSWVKCGKDKNCAQQTAGFSFPLNVPNYKIRAKRNLIEIKYPLDDKRDIYVRKSTIAPKNGDISGVYDTFPVVKQIELKNGEKVNVRGYSRKYFIVHFQISKNYYSIYCKTGLKKKEVNEIYDKIHSSDK